MSSIAVTGASSGIGQAIAEVYASKGFDLFLGARRLEKLEALSKEGEYGRTKINQYTRFLTVPLLAYLR